MNKSGVLPLLGLLILLGGSAARGQAPSTAHATAAHDGAEPTEPAIEWLARLLPHTDKPDRLASRLQRLEATEFEVAGRRAGSVTVALTYPGLDGRDEIGQARIYLPPSLRDNPSRQVPLVHHAGYEVGAKGAAKFLADGFAVCTPHAHPLNPLGRGVNLDRAILHAVRRLPCIDPLRVAIKGGSAGGWMTLMLSAESFPLVWARPDAPPIHWGYNAAYIADHARMAGPPAGSEVPRMPVLLVVGPIVEQTRKLYGMPFDSATLLAVSPLAHLDTITVPTLVTFSTADMLVPVDQVGEELAQPFDHKAFPDGFSTAMTNRFPGIGDERTLLKLLPPDRYTLFKVPLIENPTRFGLDSASPGGAKKLVLPLSKDKSWSIAVIEEGGVEPDIGHFKYLWAFDDSPFRQWAELHGVVADQLTLPKLERLMKRLCGQPWRPMRMRIGGVGDMIVANQLDYAEAERADVLLGLAAFAANDSCATRLAQCYARLPAEWQALGPKLGDGTPASVRASLRVLMTPPR